MHRIPQRVSLIVQTKEVLLDGIHRGRWHGELPGERWLCKELQVSRWTLRGALTMLARQQVIRVTHGQPCKIVKKARATGVRKRSSGDWHVGLITPEPIWRLRPFVALWIDALRVWLQSQGADLHQYDGSRYYGPGCAAALEKLTQQAPHDCWGLLLSTHAMQRWFRDRGLPVVVVGSTFEDVPLSSVDIAYRAVGRHAAGMLLAQGHRHIAWISSDVTLAGVLECQRGFIEAFASPRYADAEPIVCQHGGTPPDICRTLDRLLRRSAPPTALFLQQSNALLTTITYLAQQGLSVPRDVSIVVGEDEPYFRHLVPEIAKYSSGSDTFYRSVCRALKRAAEGTLVAGTHTQIMPDFVPGATIARFPAPAR